MDSVKQAVGELPRYFYFGSNPSTTTDQSSKAIYKETYYTTIQGIITGTGAVSATVTVQVSNDMATGQGTASNWVTLSSTLSLTGTTTDTKGMEVTGAWRFIRVGISSISGTGATVQVLMGT